MAQRSLESLTVARFGAALCVVMSHLHAVGLISAPLLYTILDGGRPAVAFFFVLSGFVLTYNYPGLDDERARRCFWAARFARLYPVHLVGLLIAAIPISVMLHRRDWAGMESDYSLKLNYGYILGHHIGAVEFLCVSFIAQLLLLTAWIPVARINQPWNGPAWSVSCEVFFYAVFPWVGPVVRRLSTRKLLLWVTALWVGQGVWLAFLQISGRGGFLVSQFPPSHLFEFVLGMAAAQVMARHQLNWLRRHALLILFLCVGVAVVIGAYAPVAPKYFLLSPVFGAVILTMAIADNLPPTFLLGPLLILLGEASYSLYIIHMPMLTAYRVVGVSVPVLIIVAFIIISSVFIHLWVEEPLRIRIRRAWGIGSRRAHPVRAPVP